MPKPAEFFRVAVEGQTIDDREISRAFLQEIEETYNPEVYTAAINVEHVRGTSAETNYFPTLGYVAAVKTQEDEFNIGGKTVKKLALYAQPIVNDIGRAINKAGQKLFASIEIKPNFHGTGKAYMPGLAFTDSPASLGTEMLKFSRPDQKGSLYSAPLEIDGTVFGTAENPAVDEVTGFFADLRKGLTGIFAKQEPAPAPEPKVDPADNAAAFTAIEKGFNQIGESLTKFAESQATRDAAAETRFATLETALGKLGDPAQPNRGQSNGNDTVDLSKIF